MNVSGFQQTQDLLLELFEERPVFLTTCFRFAGFDSIPMGYRPGTRVEIGADRAKISTLGICAFDRLGVARKTLN